jgi:hypothetical protein
MAAAIRKHPPPGGEMIPIKERSETGIDAPGSTGSRGLDVH